MNTKNTGLIAIALIVILGVGVFLFSFKGKEEMKQSVNSVKNITDSTTVEVSYKDGEYKQEGDYTSPGGPEKINVDLTLKSGVVTDVIVTSLAENPKSKFMQGVFIANYKPLVVGKNIKDLDLGKVAGSSLTPQGFNDALAKIKDAAKS